MAITKKRLVKLPNGGYKTAETTYSDVNTPATRQTTGYNGVGQILQPNQTPMLQFGGALQNTINQIDQQNQGILQPGVTPKLQFGKQINQAIDQSAQQNNGSIFPQKSLQQIQRENDIFSAQQTQISKLKAINDKLTGTDKNTASQLAATGATSQDFAEGSNIGVVGGQDNINPQLTFDAPKPPDQDAIQTAIDDALGPLRESNQSEITSLEELIAAKRKDLEGKVRADQEAAQVAYYGKTGGREGAQSQGNLSIANQEVPRAGRNELAQYDAEGEAKIAKAQADQAKEIADLTQKIKDNAQKDFDNKFKVWQAETTNNRLAKVEDRMERQFAFNQDQSEITNKRNERIQERLDKTLDNNIFNQDRNYNLREWQAKNNIDNQTLSQIQSLKKNFPGTGLAQSLMADYLLGEDPNTGLPRMNPKTGQPYSFEDLKPILETESREKLESVMEFSDSFSDLPYATRNMILESYDMENEEKFKIMSDELRKDELAKRKKSGGGGGSSGMKLTTAEVKKISFVTKRPASEIKNLSWDDLTSDEQSIIMSDQLIDEAEAWGIEGEDVDFLSSLRSFQEEFATGGGGDVSFDDL